MRVENKRKERARREKSEQKRARKLARHQEKQAADKERNECPN
jgi:hypothetical protein